MRMRSLIPTLAAPMLAGLALAAGGAAPAAAGQLCNETSYVLESAIAWRAPGGVNVQGWIRIRPGECADTPPASEVEQYLYARTTAAYLGGVREWRGAEPLCVGEGRFSIQGVEDCESVEFEPRGFRRLTASERQRATLVEPANFGDRAQEAGVQRLLQEAGYDIRVIDGYEGRRTRREIAAFEADAERDFGADRAALIDALEEAALARNSRIGLSVCNDATEPVAVAVGRRLTGEEADWESRGWWRAEPGECVRPIGESFADGDVFVHARKLIDGAPLQMARGEARFCASPSRFLAEGRDDCGARGYEDARFLPAPAPGADGRAQLRVSDDDFPSPEIADLLLPDR